MGRVKKGGEQATRGSRAATFDALDLELRAELRSYVVRDGRPL